MPLAPLNTHNPLEVKQQDLTTLSMSLTVDLQQKLLLAV